MKIRTKILLDVIIGRPMIVFYNIMARLLGIVLKRNHSTTIYPKCIVVCKLLGLGSIVQSTPLLQTLRKNFPDAKIIFLTVKSNESLIKKIKIIDTVILIDDNSFLKLLISTFSSVYFMLKNRPDTFIDLEIYSNYTSFISLMTLARNRFGYFRKESTIRLGIYTHMLQYNLKVPISEVYLQVARMMHCKILVKELYSFPITSEMWIQLKDKIKAKCKIEISNKKYILINPNASDLRIERRWPKENFIAFVNELGNHMANDFYIVLIGSKTEMDYVNTIEEQINTNLQKKILNTAGLLSLEELISLISGASCMVTNDTGPMHLAYAAGITTVCLFGPCHPQQYASYHNSKIIYKNLYCSPCIHEFIIPPCHGNNQCMKLITVDEVLKHTLDVMDIRISPATNAEEIIYKTTYSDYPLGYVTRKSILLK